MNPSVYVHCARFLLSLLEADLTSASDGHYQVSYHILAIWQLDVSCPWGHANEADVTHLRLLMIYVTLLFCAKIFLS